MALKRLLDLLDDVEDPRCSGKVEHRLTDILVIAVCAVIACAESWDDIALYGRNKLPWLKTFLARLIGGGWLRQSAAHDGNDPRLFLSIAASRDR